MNQPLQAIMSDSFSAKRTNIDKGSVTRIDFNLQSAIGEVLNLVARWNSDIHSSIEEEEKTFIQRTDINGTIRFPRGATVSYDENERTIQFTVSSMDSNKDKEKLKNLKLSNPYLEF